MRMWTLCCWSATLLICSSAEAIASCTPVFAGSPVLVCTSRQDFYKAVADAGITDMGIESFDEAPEGVYPNGFVPAGRPALFNSTGTGGGVAVRSVTGGGGLSGHVLRSSTNGGLNFNFQAGGWVLALGFNVAAELAPANSRVLIQPGFNAVFAVPATGGFIGFVDTSGQGAVGSIFMGSDFLGGDRIILADNIEYPRGPSSSQANPRPPVPCPPQALGFCYVTDTSPQWYDPPTATAFRFTAVTGQFTQVADFPTGFNAPFNVSVSCQSLGTFGPGQRVTFQGGATSFIISGIDPSVDGGNPLAFPIKLAMDTPGAVFAMEPLEELLPCDSERDQDAPALTLPPEIVVEAMGPLGTSVSYDVAASDNVDGSITPSCTPPSGSTFPLGSTTVNCSATDSHLNTATGSFSVSVRDTIGPSIAIAAPSGTTYVLNAIVTASYTCTDSGSGVAVCIGPVPSGSAIPTSTAGERAFTVSAADLSGNHASAAVRYSVGYNVSPLFDAARPFKSGSTVPLRLQLVDAAGRNVSSPGIVITATSIQMVGATVMGTPEDAGNANPDYNFRYDAALGSSGGYIYNLSTSGLAPGVYAVSFEVAGDSTPHRVQFQIK